MILSDKTDWQPTEDQIIKWVEAYPAVSVEQELKAMDAWLDANPTKRKTRRGVAKFCNSWLARAQDKGGSPMAKGTGPITKTRDMSTLDDITHNIFTGDMAMRQFFINKYGQCFEQGVRYT
jgi:hypothetical protein